MHTPESHARNPPSDHCSRALLTWRVTPRKRRKKDRTRSFPNEKTLLYGCAVVKERKNSDLGSRTVTPLPFPRCDRGERATVAETGNASHKWKEGTDTSRPRTTTLENTTDKHAGPRNQQEPLDQRRRGPRSHSDQFPLREGVPRNYLHETTFETRCSFLGTPLFQQVFLTCNVTKSCGLENLASGTLVLFWSGFM